MLNSITVDVEEYFHAANLEPVVGPARWHSMPSRVDGATRSLLELFDRVKARGTFFVLGYVARRFPQLVKDIARAGHEIASHGYGHRMVGAFPRKTFYRDVRKTKFLLEDLTGREIVGYRAPNFSIREDSLWAYDELVNAGYRYDSSLHPIIHPRYSNVHRDIQPELRQCENGALFILPLSVLAIDFVGRDLRFPVAGGAYWRLFPWLYLKWGIGKLESTGVEYRNFYLHPWEIDTGQPKFRELSFLTQLRHYGGTARLPGRILKILGAAPSIPLCEILPQLSICQKGDDRNGSRKI